MFRLSWNTIKNYKNIYLLIFLFFDTVFDNHILVTNTFEYLIPFNLCLNALLVIIDDPCWTRDQK